ncbi:MAG: AAA family ATPase [Acidimicrobiales bacterium]
MIRVEKITIQEFRGIRDLTIDFKGKNFAVCGPNGTGKSGVVDALEFGLTGSISRLSGKGTKGISIKDHAPHVDSRLRPDKAKVILTVFVPSLNKTVVIERIVSQPLTPIISEPSPKILAALKQVVDHPEFALSRRELIDYVLSTPGDRAKEVQALLRLDAIENLRSTLLKISNASKKEVEPLINEKMIAQENLQRALGITQSHQEKVLEAVNTKRAVLGLAPLTELVPETSLKDGLAVVNAGEAATAPKVQALADIKRLKEIIAELQSDTTKETSETIVKELTALKDNPLIASSVQKEDLLRSAILLVDENGCPVCDTEWNPGRLKEHINKKLEQFRDLSTQRDGLEKLISPHATALISLRDSLNILRRYGALLRPPIETDAIREFISVLENSSRALSSFIPISDTIVVLSKLSIIPGDIDFIINEIEVSVVASPEPSQQDAAREYLTVCQERLDTFRGVSQRLKKAEEKSALAKIMYDAYVKVSTETLDGIYKNVAKEFSDLYGYINSDDEKNFTAKLTPSMGKLGFDVDFYGRGYFPPGAYHSEGHQDGMGLCLYLALMKHLSGDGFTFAVLDDVLMSVDTGHRRKVCNLLKEKFPDTQFILTTHDPIWLRHMKTVGLILSSNQLHFRNWHVDHGPTEMDGRDVWQEIENALNRNDVRGAASTLRHYLEYFSEEACHSLHAPVIFRGDAHYQLGDLLPAAVGRIRRHFKSGRAAAKSWGNAVEEAKIANHEKAFSAVAAESNVEQWQMNSAIHYNDWENLSIDDFKPVVDSFERLVSAFRCPTEGCGMLYLSPDRGPAEVMRCACGATSINLKKKVGSR